MQAEILEDIHKNGKTIVVISHHEKILNKSNKTVKMEFGEIVGKERNEK